MGEPPGAGDAAAQAPTAGIGSEPPRLNPFAFPSDTTFRFVLLIAAILGVSLFTYNWLHIGLSDSEAEMGQLSACVAEREAGVSSALDITAVDSVMQRFNTCVAGTYRQRGDFMLAGVAVLLVTAIALFVAAPWWRRRRGRLVPLTGDDAPEVLAELRAISEEAGLAKPPQFLWNPFDRGVRGLAFGLVGHRYVALSGGLVILFATDRTAFRAVVHHELAHLRNRDVDITYLTVAVWQAFVLVAIVPFAASVFLITLESPDTAASLGWRLALLAILVFLTRNAVLRARELYADVRASTHEAGLRRLLANAHQERGRRIGPLRLHPTAAERAQVIDDPDRLFRLGSLEVFGVGIAATVAYHEVVSIVSFYNLAGLTTMWLAAMVFAPFAAAVVAMGAWRETFMALSRGSRPRHILRLGLALGAGALIGERISLSAAVFDQDVVLSSNVVGPDALWVAAVLGGLVLFVAWVTGSASLWIPAASGMRSPWPTSIAGLLAAGVLLALAMGMFFLVRATRPAFDYTDLLTREQHASVAEVAWAGSPELWRLVMDPMVLTYVTQPAVWALIIGVWAFPLAAALWYRRLPTRLTPSWGGLARDASPSIIRPHIQPARAVAVGAAGGLSLFILFLLVRLAARATMPEATRDTIAFALAFYFWNVGLAIVGQAVVAVLVVATTSRAAVFQALIAAFVTGIGGAVAIFSQPSLASCLQVFAIRFVGQATCAWDVEEAFVIRTLQHVVSLGFIAALAASGATLAIRAALQRLRDLRT